MTNGSKTASSSGSTFKLGLNLKMLDDLMALRHMSQRELGRRAGIHYNSIYRIIKKGQSPSLETIQSMADALGVNPMVLLTMEATEHVDH